MKALRVTLFLIAMTVLVAQTFRDVYVRWMEPRGSVLDRFSTKTEQDISSARSLDQLVALYAAAHQRVLDSINRFCFFSPRIAYPDLFVELFINGDIDELIDTC